MHTPLSSEDVTYSHARGASGSLRAATDSVHRELEAKFDAVGELADPERRDLVLSRYAALHIPADEALEAELGDVEGLDFARRSRTRQLVAFAGDAPLPAFPRPGNRAEALGMMYVLEGSTLGGKLILRELAARGVTGPELSFLDPYGSDAGRTWRSFLAVLDREISNEPQLLADATRGALRGFAHAQTILCGGPA